MLLCVKQHRVTFRAEIGMKKGMSDRQNVLGVNNAPRRTVTIL